VGVDTVLFGQGVVPLTDAGAWIRKHKPGIWVIAEQDKAEAPTAEVAKQNGAFMKRVFS
jgi:hypothetical protein